MRTAARKSGGRVEIRRWPGKAVSTKLPKECGRSAKSVARLSYWESDGMGDEKKKVLLVDDESFLLEVLTELLEEDSDRIDVVTARNGREALEILEREEIFLVVSDIYMPEVSGIHLLGRIKEKYPETAVILMTAYHTADIRSRARKAGCLHFMEKPFELAEMRKLIIDQLEKKDEGFEGTLKHIQLPDLIQMCCLSSITMAIKVKKGAKEGFIYIQDGQIVRADCGEDLSGEESFHTILCWESGSFETFDSDVVPAVNVEKNWQSLLMEAARRIDEKGAAGGQEAEQAGAAEDAEEEAGHFEGAEQIGVLIVEDSAMMFRALERILSSDPRIKALDRAVNGADALEKADALKPDLITLDVNMPVMDGGTALKHIMIRNPCPVVIVSSVTSSSQSNILDFLRLGAVDFIGKPSKGRDMDDYRSIFIDKVKTASCARVANFQRVKEHKPIEKKNSLEDRQFDCERLVVVRSGPGGYAEVMRIVPELPRILNCSLLIFQSMSPELLEPFTSYLNLRSPAPVIPLGGGDPPFDNVVLKGGVYHVVAGGTPWALEMRDGKAVMACDTGGPVGMGLHEDRFERFLISVAENFFGRVLLVLLSGAKVRGLEGIRAIREKGGRVIAQTPDSSMVPVSLEKIIATGAAELTAAPSKIADHILLDAR